MRAGQAGLEAHLARTIRPDHVDAGRRPARIRRPLAHVSNPRPISRPVQVRRSDAAQVVAADVLRLSGSGVEHTDTRLGLPAAKVLIE